MSLDQNKELIRSLFKQLGAGQLDGAFALIADDVAWWLVGAGLLTKKQISGIWTRVFSGAPGPEAMKIVRLVAEGDSVAAELESNIPLPDGRIYQNNYNIIFVLKDGKIAQAREYFDNVYAQKMFGGH